MKNPKDICLEKLAVAARDRDIEGAHGDADDAIMEFLRALGHSDVAEAFENIEKWYA